MALTVAPASQHQASTNERHARPDVLCARLLVERGWWVFHKSYSHFIYPVKSAKRKSKQYVRICRRTRFLLSKNFWSEYQFSGTNHADIPKIRPLYYCSFESCNNKLAFNFGFEHVFINESEITSHFDPQGLQLMDRRMRHVNVSETPEYLRHPQTQRAEIWFVISPDQSLATHQFSAKSEKKCQRNR